MNADGEGLFSRDAERSVGAAGGWCAAMVLTANAPGAIAIVQLMGDVEPILSGITQSSNWPIGRLRLVDFDGIDEGLAVRLSENAAQLMPHGGPRVVQRLLARLVELGAEVARPDGVDARVPYPEAEDECEALMLATLARAASPLAIDALLAQPAVWRSLAGVPISDDERARSSRLNRLITPPLLVLAGPPNVGKSTLSNTLLGRSMSIAVDMPGTTRDYTAGLIDLGGLVVQWHDTPGIRDSDDAIEMRAIELSGRLIERADSIIAMTDAEHDWPELRRAPDLRIANKADVAARSDADLNVSAVTGAGITDLVRTVRDALVPPSDLAAVMEMRWVFDARLERVSRERSASRRG